MVTSFLLKVLHTLKILCSVPIYQHVSKCVQYRFSFPETHEFDYLHVIQGFLFPEIGSVSSKSLPAKRLGWRDPADRFARSPRLIPAAPEGCLNDLALPNEPDQELCLVLQGRQSKQQTGILGFIKEWRDRSLWTCTCPASCSRPALLLLVPSTRVQNPLQAPEPIWGCCWCILACFLDRAGLTAPQQVEKWLTAIGLAEVDTHGMVWLKSFTLAIKLVKCRERFFFFFFSLKASLTVSNGLNEQGTGKLHYISFCELSTRNTHQ